MNLNKSKANNVLFLTSGVAQKQKTTKQQRKFTEFPRLLGKPASLCSHIPSAKVLVWAPSSAPFASFLIPTMPSVISRQKMGAGLAGGRPPWIQETVTDTKQLRNLVRPSWTPARGLGSDCSTCRILHSCTVAPGL